MNKLFQLRYVFLLVTLFLSGTSHTQPVNFSLSEVMSYPFPSGLVGATHNSRIAWIFNESGLRNVYVAEGPDFTARKLTRFNQDDGQALSSLSISSDGTWVVFIRGGDFGGNWGTSQPVNPTFSTLKPKIRIWAVPFRNGNPRVIGDGTSPVITPDNKNVTFIKNSQVWIVPIDGSAKPHQLFYARGSIDSQVWSPDGTRLAFRSNRSDHSFIGIFSGADHPVLWIDPSFNRDRLPHWSPDGSRLVFIRQPGRGGAPDSILTPRHHPWMIMTAETTGGKARMIWKAPETLRGSPPNTQGGINLHWAAKGRIVFLSYQDGWPHLYSISENGGDQLLLTPGHFMAEYIRLSPDRRWLVFCGNTGRDKLDVDRRHVIRVPVDRQNMEVMTPGEGLEWTPVITGGGKYLVYLSATAQRPPLPAVMDLESRHIKLLATGRIPDSFPVQKLVTPKQVIFNAPDGTTLHGTLFLPENRPGRKPAIVYIHGGPPRQMLLGWHYSSYYSNGYAVNQYLTSLGYVVLSINYRLGIGYGYEFHNPLHANYRGAAEYQDIKAAGEWLARQTYVDPQKIGVYGGSYGGYLTAMALARNSDLFAAGVDIHGVHDRSVGRAGGWSYPDRYEKAPDWKQAVQAAWQSSPVAYVKNWRSPVLIIHGDDDRNVRFSESTGLVQRLKKRGVYVETLVIVDDTHHFLMHHNQLTVNLAIADFFTRKLPLK